MLSCFGVRVAADSQRRRGGAPLKLSVRQHPVFGPVTVIGRAGQPAVVRITPLTDQDVRGMLKAVEVPNEGGEVELLCRLSQLIEELPWLAELEAELVEAADASLAALGGELSVAVTRPA